MSGQELSKENETGVRQIACKLLMVNVLGLGKILENMAMAGLRTIYVNRDADSMGIGAQKEVLQAGNGTE